MSSLFPHGPTATTFALMRFVLEQGGEQEPRSEKEILELFDRCGRAVRDLMEPRDHTAV